MDDFEPPERHAPDVFDPDQMSQSDPGITTTIEDLITKHLDSAEASAEELEDLLVNWKYGNSLRATFLAGKIKGDIESAKMLRGIAAQQRAGRPE